MYVTIARLTIIKKWRLSRGTTAQPIVRARCVTWPVDITCQQHHVSTARVRWLLFQVIKYNIKLAHCETWPVIGISKPWGGTSCQRLIIVHSSTSLNNSWPTIELCVRGWRIRATNRCEKQPISLTALQSTTGYQHNVTVNMKNDVVT